MAARKSRTLRNSRGNGNSSINFGNGRRNSVEQSTNRASRNSKRRISGENRTIMEQGANRRRGRRATNRGVLRAVNNGTQVRNNGRKFSKVDILRKKEEEMHLRRVKYFEIFKSHKCKQCIVCTFSDTEDYSSNESLTSTKRFYNVRSIKKIECNECGILPYNGNEMLIGSIIHTERKSGTMDNSFHNRRGNFLSTAHDFIREHLLNIEESQRIPLIQDLLLDKCKFLLYSWIKSPIKLNRRAKNRLTNALNRAINSEARDVDDKSTIRDDNSVADVSSAESERNSESGNSSESERRSEQERILEDEEKFKNESTTYDDDA
ncbi:hypothetical protein POCGH01_00011500 [Plasmodium ovale]|uniref:Uncharacterized protein n=2 Tax=Plasmodium ovale TaxID=36330 RepID=A0A1A8WN27_PLAOA|nr:hypothetical protein POVCU2_0079940 [Plasmodium ovale curtisi]SBT83837.1 hypothetical protein POCGH01_00011500 [Plasmodium ovale]